jgi:hypothetical protein
MNFAGYRERRWAAAQRGRWAGVAESARLSEAALAEDWNRPEEDEAWSHLQQVR